MIVGKSNSNYELTLNSNNILTIDELKLLGVTVDNKLTFSSHIKLIHSKIHAKIAALRRIRNSIRACVPGPSFDTCVQRLSQLHK